MNPRSRQRWTLIAAIIGLNITILDETVVFLALPSINRDLGLGLSGQQWIVNAYLLSLSALLLVGGSLADLFGRRRVLLLGLGGFGLASLACGLAPTASFLIVFRLIQGAAAAMVMPATLALVSSAFHGDERGAAVGSWASWGAVAASIGPIVAGVLIASFSWRSIFFLSLPLVAAAAAIGLVAVDESRDETIEARRIDIVGAGLAALALGGLSFALIQGTDIGWGRPSVLAAAGAGLLTLVAFLIWEARTPFPLLPLRLFRSRNLSAANGATLALYAVFNGNFFILTIYLQTALGYSPLAAGAATLPVTLMMIFLASRLGRWSARTGPRLPMTVGMLLTALGLGLLAFVRPGDAYPVHILPGIVTFGLGLALTVPPLTNTAVSSIPDSQAGVASGVNDLAARVAALLGVAVCGLAFSMVFRATLVQPGHAPDPKRAAIIQQARQQPTSALDIRVPEALRHELSPELARASTSAYAGAMIVGVLIALGGFLVCLLGIENTRTGRRP